MKEEWTDRGHDWREGLLERRWLLRSFEMTVKLLGQSLKEKEPLEGGSFTVKNRLCLLPKCENIFVCVCVWESKRSTS